MVVIHHGVVAVLVCELYVWVPLCSCLGVVSKVDGSGILIVAVDNVNHSTGHKGIANISHLFCFKQRKRQTMKKQTMFKVLLRPKNNSYFSLNFKTILTKH